jgi:hypothetical protein
MILNQLSFLATTYAIGVLIMTGIMSIKLKNRKLAWKRVTRSFWLQLLGFFIAVIIMYAGKIG